MIQRFEQGGECVWRVYAPKSESKLARSKRFTRFESVVSEAHEACDRGATGPNSFEISATARSYWCAVQVLICKGLHRKRSDMRR